MCVRGLRVHLTVINFRTVIITSTQNGLWNCGTLNVLSSKASSVIVELWKNSTVPQYYKGKTLCAIVELWKTYASIVEVWNCGKHLLECGILWKYGTVEKHPLRCGVLWKCRSVENMCIHCGTVENVCTHCGNVKLWNCRICHVIWFHNSTVPHCGAVDTVELCPLWNCGTQNT